MKLRFQSRRDRVPEVHVPNRLIPDPPHSYGHDLELVRRDGRSLAPKPFPPRQLDPSQRPPARRRSPTPPQSPQLCSDSQKPWICPESLSPGAAAERAPLSPGPPPSRFCGCTNNSRAMGKSSRRLLGKAQRHCHGLGTPSPTNTFSRQPISRQDNVITDGLRVGRSPPVSKPHKANR